MRRPLDYIVMESLACAIQHPVIRPGAKAPWHRFWMLRKNDRVVSMTRIPDCEWLDSESSVTEQPAWEIYSFLHVGDISKISLLTDSTNFSTGIFNWLFVFLSLISLSSFLTFPSLLPSFLSFLCVLHTIFIIFSVLIEL